MQNQKLCKKCILPESKPDIWLNEDGICNICLKYQKESKNQTSSHDQETDFIKILNKFRGKGAYDCLVMCSGGKDSISSLYYMKKRYKLNPLAYTFDHGFENEEALENIKNAVEILGVDFLFFKSTYMKDMFKNIIKENPKVVLCHVCSLWYMDITLEIAQKFKIPLIIAGWTKGQSEKHSVGTKEGLNINQLEFEAISNATKRYIKRVSREIPKYKNFPMSMDEVLKKAQKKHKFIVLSPHWFLPFDEDKYVETITKELKWQAPRLSYPRGSTNCFLNFISVYLSLKNYGYTHYHVELSKLIRKGLITREDALKRVEINFDQNILNDVAQKLGHKF